MLCAMGLHVLENQGPTSPTTAEVLSGCAPGSKTGKAGWEEFMETVDSGQVILTITRKLLAVAKEKGNMVETV